MHDRIRHTLTRTLLPMLAAALAAAWVAPAARAAAYTYSTRQRTVNAGVLIVDDAGSNDTDAVGPPQGVPSNLDPYVFYIFNNRSDLKPFGWNLVNPLAPRTVTGDIAARWNARTSAAGLTYTLNQPVTPSMAAYWEVSLSKTTLVDLLQYDVLLLNLNGHNQVRFTDDELHKLRRFVDAGGQLWIDSTHGGNVAVSGTPATSALFFDAIYQTGGAATQAVLPTDFNNGLALHQPVIAAPYLLSQDELSGLGGGQTGTTITNAAGGTADSTILSTVVASDSSGAKALITAGQYGAGQIVMTSTGSAAAINNAVLGIDSGIGGGANPNSGPYCGSNFIAAPSPDLKLVADILSWTAAHPSEYKNSHQSSLSAAALGPALAPTWSYPNSAAPPAGAPSPGAAINGSFVFVRGADGVLRAFNATPGTDILGAGVPDAGFPDYSQGKSWDEIWSTGGDAYPKVTPFTLPADPFASAPTVAAIGTGVTLVFVEDSSGVVHAADAATGAAYKTGVLTGSGPGANPGGTPYAAATGPAPAPTYFGGRLYAGQPDGTLYVYNFATGQGVKYPFSNNKEPVVAPPAVGIVREDISNSYVDDIIAAVATNQGVYTVQCGVRHDPLNVTSPNGGMTNVGTIDSNLQSAGVMIEPPPTPSHAYYDDPQGYPITVGTATSTGFSISSANQGQYFGDFDVLFDPADTKKALQRSEYTVYGASLGSPASAVASPPSQSAVSAPALAADGNIYYTVNLPIGSSGAGSPSTIDSTLVCVHDARQDSTKKLIRWRFRLPYVGENVVDADGVSYAGLAGFHFVGAPVVDSRNDVYALASDGVRTAILCFNGEQGVSAALVNPNQVPTNTVSPIGFTQPAGGPLAGRDEFGGPLQPLSPVSGQLDGNGNLNFQNFAAINAAATPVDTKQLLPNLSEPQPVSVTYGINNNNANTTTTTTALLHTNLTWFTLLSPPTSPPPAGFPASVIATSGLTLVGNYLFFGARVTDANNNTVPGNVCRFYAYPQDAGLVGGGRFVSPAGTDTSGRTLLAFVPTSVDTIGGVVSASNGVLIANGRTGVAAFGSQYTLVADGNRILEVDSDGAATWAVDSTSGPAAGGRQTHLELNHPSSVTQISANDYLVADTGNNRCVRFDRSGNAVWELTRFSDAVNPAITTLFGKSAALLSPGESTTLNHPTSVSTYTRNNIKDANGGTYTAVHYLIADTGNYRVVDVVDVYDGNGNPVGPRHNLVWISHTYDQQGRPYRYTSANYFVGPDGFRYVVALISNTRVATPLPLTNPGTGTLNAASADAPGSTIVLLDYDPSGSNPTAQKNGYISHAANSFYANYMGTGAGRTFDLADAPKATQTNPIPTAATGAPTPTRVYLRNPRFLQTYTAPGGTGALQNFLLADDNGVYDLFLDASTGKLTSGAFVAQWGMTQTDYRTLPGALDSRAPPLTRANIPFVPNSLQRTGTDPVAGFLIGHYIVSNGYTQGEVTPISGFGGEVLELSTTPALTPLVVGAFSKVGGTSPLSQPAFAAREK